MKRATLRDSTGEGVCRGSRGGLPVSLFFLVGFPVEWRPGGLESELYLLTIGIRLCAQSIVIIPRRKVWL